MQKNRNNPFLQVARVATLVLMCHKIPKITALTYLNFRAISSGFVPLFVFLSLPFRSVFVFEKKKTNRKEHDDRFHFNPGAVVPGFVQKCPFPYLQHVKRMHSTLGLKPLAAQCPYVDPATELSSNQPLLMNIKNVRMLSSVLRTFIPYWLRSAYKISQVSCQWLWDTRVFDQAQAV